MKRKMTIWWLALLLLLTGCGAAEGTEPALPDNSDVIASEEVVQLPQTDITDSAIASVFEWFMANMEGKEEYSITYPETDFELVMRRKEQ